MCRGFEAPSPDLPELPGRCSSLLVGSVIDTDTDLGSLGSKVSGDTTDVMLVPTRPYSTVDTRDEMGRVRGGFARTRRKVETCGTLLVVFATSLSPRL